MARSSHGPARRPCMLQIRPFVLAALLAVPALAEAKRPEPITCPVDVALALAEACPCEGAPTGNGPVVAWKNHGKYVSCVVHFRNALRKAGCLTQDDKRTIARCAARSTCGKADTALCCTLEVGLCMGDPM